VPSAAMGEPLEVRPLLRATRHEDLAPETKALKELKPSFTRQEHSRIAGANFSPVAPHRLAVVSGTKVGIWQPSSLKENALEEGKSISKFKDVTLCASWRSDGKLLLVGEAGGSCAVVEVDRNTPLRRLRGHGDAVTCAAFAEADKSRCATGCKDGKLRLWDVSTSELITTFESHQDVMKTCCVGPTGGSWITAGHDQMVKLWDERSKPDKPAIAVDHGSPVECGCPFPSAALYASGGGTSVRVWDLAMTGKTLQDLPDAHSKVIMDMALDSQSSTLITASFDGFVKVFNSMDFTHLCSYKQSGPCTCVAWRPDGNGLMIGLDDGNWQFRSRRSTGPKKKKPVVEGELVTGKRVFQRGKRDGPLKDDEEEEESDVERLKSKKWKREEGFLRGHLHQPEPEDQIIDQVSLTRRRDSKVTYLFRKFEYRKLAEYLFLNTNPKEPALGLSIANEMLEQGALASGLRNLGEDLCLEALRWLNHALGVGTDSMQQSLTHEILLQLIDSNDCLQPPRSKELLSAMSKVRAQLWMEIQNQDVLFQTTGAIESIFA